MPVFTDESGDSGPKPTASKFFYMAAVWFETIEEGAACRAAIEALRVATGRTGYVYHACETPPQVREEFLTCVSSHPFKVAWCVIDKDAARGRRIKLSHDTIERTAGDLLAGALHEYLLIAEEQKSPVPLNERVTVGHHDSKSYIQNIRDAFMALTSGQGKKKGLVKKVAPERPASDDLVQLADMVCSACRESHEGEKDRYRLIEGKCIAGLTWPPNE